MFASYSSTVVSLINAWYEKSLSTGDPCRSCLHSGQIALRSVSQGMMHELWNTWLHGNTRTLSPTTKSPRQIEQDSPIWLDTHTNGQGRMVSHARTGGGACAPELTGSILGGRPPAGS